MSYRRRTAATAGVEVAVPKKIANQLSALPREMPKLGNMLTMVIMTRMKAITVTTTEVLLEMS